MNKLHQIVFKSIVLSLCLYLTSGYGQKESKTYKETFVVGKNAVVDINTSHADIEFTTWNKDQVVVEATIELEGASPEEAEAYFDKGGIKILGNSQEITIKTGRENSWIARGAHGDAHNIIVEIPEIPEMPELEPLFLDIQIPELPDIPQVIMEMPLPPMPPMQFRNFDYEAYKKDGEKYLKEWSEEFEKSFDEGYQKEIEEWGKEMQARVEEREAAREEMMKEREEMMKEREEVRREAQEIRREAMEERREIMEEQRKIAEKQRKIQKNVIISRQGKDSPTIYYRSSDGGGKNYKIKKTIKIKMPKSTKLKMNVRHGEVKLAENTRNMNATLSYARLLASTIDGVNTNIVASYSPVSVERWNYGNLNINFSDDVALQDVNTLTLSTTSSDITIDRLLKSAQIKNDLGAIRINAIASDFKDLDIAMQNGELICNLPVTPFSITIDATSSKYSAPAELKLASEKNGNHVVHNGYYLEANSGKSIVIDSRYSEILLQQ
ncbi:hypothetical protein [uncultured Eudoraea sp.]|uniref:hypothetical protein n=1 Tax=uncultured Eudoraea sp. TaxID=1035614 RepID=UPI00262B8707|nr:hypothetical protein [uncultured Eudoraea sp.]